MSDIRLNIGGDLTPQDGITPMTLNVSYRAPKVLTCRIDRPTEFIPARFGGRSVAQLYVDDVLWFTGRYAGLSETRGTDGHSTLITFVGPKADLNFTVTADNGSPIINFGNDTIAVILVKLSFLQSVIQGLADAGVTFPSVSEISNSGLNQDFVPGVYELVNRTLREAIDQVFEYAPRFQWLVNSNNVVTFYHIDALTDVTVSLNGDEIHTYSLQEDALDRYAAVRLIGDIIEFDGIPVFDTLTPGWNTNLETDWTIHDFYRLASINPTWSEADIQDAIERGNVYRKWTITSTGLASFNQGAPVQALQQYEVDKNDATQDIWNPVEIQDVDWPNSTVYLKWPAIVPTVTKEQSRSDTLPLDANIPGKAAQAKSIRLLGTGFASVQPGKRFPAVDFVGQAFEKYGNEVERIIYQSQRNTLNDQYLSLLHTALSNLLISGSITLNTLRSEFLDLGTWLNVTDKRGTFGLENLNMLVSSAQFNIEAQRTTLVVSTDRRPFTLGT